MAHRLIRNGTLIDGCGGPPVTDAAVLLEDDRIRAAGPAAGLELPDAEPEMIDAGGGFILPGFIDAHVHLMSEGTDLMAEMTRPFSLNFYRAIDHMRRTLDAGVTGVRDAGGADLGVQQAVEFGFVAGPRMQISVTILTTTGGHADFRMPSGIDYQLLPSYPGRPSCICDGVEGVRRKVREVLRDGAEVIKVCASGGVFSPTDHPEFTQFSIDELAVMVEEGAYRRGVKVMAHAEGADSIKNAVLAGVHSIEHGIYLDEEGIELMLERGTYLVPTLLVGRAMLAASAGDDGLPEWGARKAREVFAVHRENMTRAYQAGVRIVMGTDAGPMPHGTNLGELELMCEIGMTPMEAIVAGTRTAAECLGWEERLGTVTAGKLADLVICRSDPLADIAVLGRSENIVLVMKDGRVVKDRRSAPTGVEDG